MMERGAAPGPGRSWDLAAGLCGWPRTGLWNSASLVSQLVITASQIQWTADVTKCLLTAKERGDRKILKVMKKKQVGSPAGQAGPGVGVSGDEGHGSQS